MRETARASMLTVAALTIAAAALEGQNVPIPDSLPPGVTAESVRRGKVVFEGPGLCANCHGPLAQGLLGPNLTDSEWWHVKGTYLAIVQRVLSGVPPEESVSGITMKPRGGSSISDADVMSVAAYVWTLSHPEAVDSLPIGVTPYMVTHGREIFLGAGGCATCHGADARGNVGPNLTDDEWLHAKGSYLSIVSQILSGVPAEKSRSGVAMLPRGGANLSDADVHAVAAYVWVLSHPHHW